MMKKVWLWMVVMGCSVGGVSAAKKETSTEKITQAVSGLEVVKPKQKRKMLVFCLTRGFHHASIGTGKIALKVMAEKTGAFEAVISDDLANFEPDKIHGFDAICFMNTTKEVFSPSKKQLAKMSGQEKQAAAEREARLKKSLMDFIKSGKGFVGIHAATDTFYQWPEYGDMIGGYFDGHPWRAKTQVSIKVEDGEEEHPCCAHLDGKNLNFKEEIYQFKDPYDPKKLHILLRLDPKQTDISIGKRKDNDYGVSWVKHHGKGRIFYSSLGHNHHIFENPKVLQHYLKGMQWALGDIEMEVKTGK
ncbi:ThuA domain-containing protein [Verrucomicrobiaceae bacterium 5K15]|uniref:ThuA domain-containing protein n=1 Tax=Oceaniferula flava TaxID=2800421 RepID=A0AAE2V976_9BACT|nr:ThuA domain-containing protein [Oceaniferula flavus]MBK1854638.1 ThuA domain-containing protein [Oceaniferula flavus]MBM1135944.1 ThuA domain-containing protein [Oceaniferula flavus]